MVKLYNALALQTIIRGVQKREDAEKNLEHIEQLMMMAIDMVNVELPIKLVALPEGAIHGFTDEFYDMPHLEFYLKLALNIPGEETDKLGDLAKKFNTYIIAQARARNSDFKNRYFNCAFIINPKGKVIQKYHKLQVWYKEHTTTPHDMWDEWIKMYGYNLDAFYPVADTEIGKIGMMICQDAEYPEIARGLAMNGAEIIYRGAEAEPLIGRGQWELQNRARAFDNTCYVIAPNIGGFYPTLESTVLMSISGGKSMITNYKGELISKAPSNGAGFAAAVINIEELREYRIRSMNGNWLRDLRTEQYKLIYENPIWPKNLCINNPPGSDADVEKIAREVTAKLIKDNIWKECKSKKEKD